MSEIKEIINKEKKEEIKAEVENPEIKNIKSTLEKSEQEKSQMKKEISDLKFTNDFNAVAVTYPHAREFGDKIHEKVMQGYSVEDATVSVLAKENKLITADQIKEEENKGKGLGGSADNVRFDKSSKEKSLDELKKDFQDMETRGEIRLT